MHPRLLATGLVVVVATTVMGCGASTSGQSSSGSGSGSGNNLPVAGSSAARTVGPAGTRVVPVVAAENFWGDITRQIGGAHVSVTSIISDPNADPHTYETDPRDAAAVSRASFVILNGVGYDDFASRLLAASPSKTRTVLTVADIVGVRGSNPNPHLWYDPAYVAEAAAAIMAGLQRADPVDSTLFAQGEQAFMAAYQPYVDELARIRAKYAGTHISYTERVPGYLVEAAGLVLGTPAGFSQAVEDGNDPSPGDTAVFDADIAGHKVRALLYNAQVTDEQTSAIRQLAVQAGVPVVGVTETLPAGENFQTWQLMQARQLLAALGG